MACGARLTMRRAGAASSTLVPTESITATGAAAPDPTASSQRKRNCRRGSLASESSFAAGLDFH